METKMFSLSGRVAVITGGGSGIGRAIAILFAQQGAQVAVIDLQEAAARETAHIISTAGGTARAYICNVALQTTIHPTIQQIKTDFGTVDVLVNSAGIAHIGKLGTTTEADFDRVFQVNVKGVYNAMHAVIPIMSAQQHGVILNLASVASSVGIADRFAYSMSKGAVLAMTLSVAKDYVKEGIRCNCISPGRVHTPFVDGFLKANYPGREAEMFEKLSQTQPIGRMARPDEIASLALYLCSDEAGFITGTDYPIDGGFIKLNS
jgi:NAD(P)-dependent dehydrogenase (short-subunit alcohol dehydrogenase family)